MELLTDGLWEALRLVAAGDAEVLGAAWRSLWISILAVLLAALPALPLGALLARWRGRRARFVIALLRAGVAIPTVFIGLTVFALFARRGPLGALGWLYSPWAILVGEVLLAAPILATLTHGAVAALDPRARETAQTLGASPLQILITELSEARAGLGLALLTAFGRCLTELGIAMMVGGNIPGRTRTLPTAIALETGQGQFERGLAMGLLLMALALAVTLAGAWLSSAPQGASKGGAA